MGLGDCKYGPGGPCCGPLSRGIIQFPPKSAILTHEIATLSEEIRRLLDQPLSQTRDGYVTRLEQTLTEGYARALGLEAERVRLERQLGQVARALDGQYDPKRARELALIANRVTAAEEELTGLRGLLVALRERFETVNAAY
jgi:hypothetical protein